MALLPVGEAQRRLIGLVQPLPLETVPLLDAQGRWLAEPVFAKRTQPFADLSAMDGYAIRFSELPGPWTVVAESKAGSSLGAPLDVGQAARIFTGAPIPPGADTILIQEEAAREGDTLLLNGEGPGRAGRHIRPRAMDFLKGDLLVAAGEQLNAAHIALAAAGGHARVAVRRRARIAIISTGDELIPVGEMGADHQLPSSNAPMLAALLGGRDAVVEEIGIAPDRLDVIAGMIKRASDADIIITTGGVSVGDHDLVKPAFEAAGATLDFWKVAMRPGKPLMAGTLGRSIVLGLPGNPLSAFVTASVFARPLIAALGGAAKPFAPTRRARLGRMIPPNGGRDHYMRGIWGEDGVVALDGQDSAALTNLTQAQLFIIRHANAPMAAAGDLVDIIDIA
ncbi:MAG: gephyrin-like molybdotransferase Glp [Sphingomonadaceae bacterium]